MKVKFRGRRGTITFTGSEGRRLVEHIRQGGSLGDIKIPSAAVSAELLEATVPLDFRRGDAGNVNPGTGGER